MDLKNINYNDAGLVPAIVQDYHTRKVLMMAWMNEQALQMSLDSKVATFYSRSRKKIWVKGESSGNFQTIVSIDYDCDEDSLLLQVIPQGPACHTGAVSCFYRNLMTNSDLHKGNLDILYTLSNLIAKRYDTPKEGSYTNYLFAEGVDKICKKLVRKRLKPLLPLKITIPTNLLMKPLI